jgi:hypothetical protein
VPVPTEADATERFVRLSGEEFRAAWPVPVMALAEFAHVSQGGADSNDMDGLAAMYDLFESVIDPEDWDRFKRHAKKSRATDKDLMLLVRKVITGQTDRPTVRPSDSSDGPEVTEPSSESEQDSSEPSDLTLRVVQREERGGRPDRALMVLMAHEASVA